MLVMGLLKHAKNCRVTVFQSYILKVDFRAFCIDIESDCKKASVIHCHIELHILLTTLQHNQLVLSIGFDVVKLA